MCSLYVLERTACASALPWAGQRVGAAWRLLEATCGRGEGKDRQKFAAYVKILSLCYEGRADQVRFAGR